MHWRRKWQPTPVFLPRESHGRKSLVGYSPRGRKELHMTQRLHFDFLLFTDFPGGLADKESTCNAGDPSSIPRLGRSTGEWIGYPLQYSWASPVAQLVKNPPVMREIWVRSLGWEDPLEKGKATHSNIPAWRIPWTVYSMRSQRVGHD